MGQLSIAQRYLLYMSVFLLLFGVGGLFVNADFGTGDDVTSSQYLWLDVNGWHALTIVVGALGGLALFRDRRATRIFLLASVALNAVGALWPIHSGVQWGIVYLGDPGDIVFHALLAVTALGAWWLDRTRSPSPAT